jgi:hypothetical protein
MFISQNNFDADNDDIQSKIFYTENMSPKKVLEIKLKGKFSKGTLISRWEQQIRKYVMQKKVKNGEENLGGGDLKRRRWMGSLRC